MDATKLVGLSLVIPAAAVLAWRFRQTPRSRGLKLGRLEFKLKPRKRYDIPTLASIATTAVGGGLLALERSGLRAKKP